MLEIGTKVTIKWLDGDVHKFEVTKDEEGYIYFTNKKTGQNSHNSDGFRLIYELEADIMKSLKTGLILSFKIRGNKNA